MNGINITSIGWLNGFNGFKDTVRLTPCINGSSHPIFITISCAEFELIRGDENAMKQKALEKLQIMSDKTKTRKKSGYYIVNEFDRPYERLIAAEWNGKLYYLKRGEEEEMRKYDGMRMDDAAPIEDFGFDVLEDEQNNIVYFVKVRPSIIKYKRDGKTREWQGIESITLPMLGIGRGRDIETVA